MGVFLTKNSYKKSYIKNFDRSKANSLLLVYSVSLRRDKRIEATEPLLSR